MAQGVLGLCYLTGLKYKSVSRWPRLTCGVEARLPTISIVTAKAAVRVCRPAGFAKPGSGQQDGFNDQAWSECKGDARPWRIAVP